MKHLICITLLFFSFMATAQENKTIENTIIELEKAALEKWNNGDPSAFLALSASDVVYFDPFLEKRINGLAELTKLYESLKGQVSSNRFELINPLVQASEKMAVLTFNYVSYSGNTQSKWNCTEVYRCEPDGKWKIIQTHWSLTKPELK